MQYVYFVSYSWQTRFQQGFGNTDFTLSCPTIPSIEAIREIEAGISEALAEAGLNDACVQVLNYQLLREMRLISPSKTQIY